LALGFDEKFIRIWEYYFDYCAAGFKSRTLGNYQVIPLFIIKYFLQGRKLKYLCKLFKIDEMAIVIGNSLTQVVESGSYPNHSVRSNNFDLLTSWTRTRGQIKDTLPIPKPNTPCE